MRSQIREKADRADLLKLCKMWPFDFLLKFFFGSKNKSDEDLNSQDVNTSVGIAVEDPSASTNLQNGCFPSMCRNTLSCDLCDKFLKSSDVATSYANGRSFPIMGQLHCQMQNLIYLVSCTEHRLQYVGSTNNVQKRWADHKSKMKTAIKNGLVSKDSGLSEHVSVVHKDWPNPCQHLELLLLESVDDVKNIKTREDFWMKCLETLQFGLNKQPSVKKTKMFQTFSSNIQDCPRSDGIGSPLSRFQQFLPVDVNMEYRSPAESESMDEDSSEEPEDEDLEQTSMAANTSHPEFGFELYGVETLINLFNFFSVDSLLF